MWANPMKRHRIIADHSSRLCAFAGAVAPFARAAVSRRRFTLLSATALLVCLSSAELAAHGWYPKLCCNDQDCFKATAVVRLVDGSLKIDAGHITVIVPRGFEARPSQDNDTHVCVYRDGMGRYQPRCVFVPGIS